MTRIRTATEADVGAVAAIYAEAVLNTPASFDVDPPSVEAWAQRLASTDTGNHVLVAEGESGAVVGFARSCAFRPKAAYESTRETSVYTAAEARGQGVGSVLYAALLDAVAASGTHLVVAGVAEPNPASARLHLALGFEPVGTLLEVGHKFGCYWDVTWYQKRLG